MSCATIIIFKDGVPDSEIEYRNSHGGAARIWTSVYDTYLKDPNKLYDSWLMTSGAETSPLWALPYDSRLETFERVVHGSTFDRFYVLKKDFKRYAEDLRAFIKKHPVDPNRVDHLPDWADFIESCEGEAIGYHATSVADNPWLKYNEDTEEEEKVPLSKGYNIYEWIEEISKVKTTNDG